MRNLKPCPFCGEKDALKCEVRTSRDNVQEGWIECQNCGARGQTEYGQCPPDEMISLTHYGWNERAAEQSDA